MSDLAKYINELAGDYVESWVGEHLASEWQKDKDEIERLTAQLEQYSMARKYAAELDCMLASHAKSKRAYEKMQDLVERIRDALKDGDT